MNSVRSWIYAKRPAWRTAPGNGAGAVKFVFFACFIGLFFFSSCPAGAGPLVLLTEENPPYNFTRQGKLTGVTAELVQEIMRRQGAAFPVQVVPWARGYQRLQTEPNVILFTTARTEEREDKFHWVGPLYSFRLVFYARKDSGIKVSSTEEAQKVGSIATYRDDLREQLLLSMGFENLDSATTPQSGLRKLISGRVDLWFFDNVGAPRVAQEAGVDWNRLEEVFTYQQRHSYIALSEGISDTVVKQWQATLDEMKADGTYWWICRKWMPSGALLPRTGAAGEEIRPVRLFLYTENAPPSTYMEDGRISGLSAEIVGEILHRVNRPDPIDMVPWARGYELALSQPGVVLFSTTRLPQREDLFFWVGPLYSQTWGFYALKGKGPRIDSLEDAAKVGRIGVYRRDAKMQYLEKKGFGNLVPTNDNTNNIQHLIRGDIDLWVTSDFNVNHQVRQAGVDPSQLERAFPFLTVNNYIAFSRKTSPHIVSLWQKVFEEIRNDGTYEKIRRTYASRIP
ncbi:MAG: ABC transporter substrate-binding protein [Desulfobacterales bacterium]|nr:ABC transporter substrate-binding protein [Desulfobacterales bacterium]